MFSEDVYGSIEFTAFELALRMPSSNNFGTLTTRTVEQIIEDAKKIADYLRTNVK